MTVEMTRPASRVAAILRRVLRGETPQIHYLQGILEAHGWPDVDAVRANAEALERLGDLDVTFDVEDDLRTPWQKRGGRTA